MRHSLVHVMLAGGLLCSGALVAQSLVAQSLVAQSPDAPPAAPPTQLTNEPSAATAREQVVQSFNRRAPQSGQPLPDLELLDSQGHKFAPSEFRGHYSVLVFGCLT